MLDARTVLRQVDRRLPPYWRLYRYRRRSDAARLGVNALILGILALTAQIASAAAGDTIIPGARLLLTMGTSGHAVSAVLNACALAAEVAGLVPLVGAVRSGIALVLPASRRPVLVLLPEGCVERTGALPRRVRVVSFADISHIELRVSKIQMVANRYTAGLPIVSTRSSIRLILHDWKGGKRGWTLRAGFGPPATLAQAILAAYGEYTNSVSARRPRVRPAAASGPHSRASSR
jgi:hypothetical protein